MSPPENANSTGFKRYSAYLLAAVFALFACAWIYSAGFKMYYMDAGYGGWTAKSQMIKNCDVGEIAVVGDSRASAAFIPSILGKNVRNLALTGASPVENYYALQRILACPNKPKAIVLSISPRQFESSPWFWKQGARYGFFSFKDLEDVRRQEQVVGVSELYLGAYGTEPPAQMKNWLYATSFPPFEYASVLASIGVPRHKQNLKIFNETLADQGHHLVGEGKCARLLGVEAESPHFKPGALEEAYFKRDLKLIHDHGVEVYLIQTPISQMTAQKTSPEFTRAFSQFLARQVAAAPYVKTIGATLPIADDCDFGDEHHLNLTGATAFSNSLAKDFASLK